MREQFPVRCVIIPRIERPEDEKTAPTAAVAARASHYRRLEVRERVQAGHYLERRGLSRASEVAEGVSPRRGIVAAHEALGTAVAYFGSAGDMAEATSELAADFEVVEDFALEMPTPAAQGDSIVAPGGMAAREWPAISGVAAAHAAGIKGAGVLVGVLDTGVDADHFEFKGRTVTYRYVSFFPGVPNWPPRDVRGFDTGGHGTHVCGIVAGNTVGVAPAASLYAACVIESETTRTSLARVTAGLNWLMTHFTTPANEPKPALVNMSLGFPSSAPGDIGPGEFATRMNALRSLLAALRQANILPIVAIGNSGPGTFGLPGAFKTAVGVGAVDFSANVANFSGDGNPTTEATVKPDLSGYGVDVMSSLERTYSGDAVYARMRGTSMAAPYVTGIAALYASRAPSLSATGIETLLKNNAVPIAASPAHRAGKGLARFV